MNIIDIIKEDIHSTYFQRMGVNGQNYVVTCSLTIMKAANLAIREMLESSAKLLVQPIIPEDATFSELHLPYIGNIRFQVDKNMSGYSIEIDKSFKVEFKEDKTTIK